MYTPQTKKKQLPVSNSILESLRDLSSGVGKSVTEDVAKGVAKDALSSLFGNPASTFGELKPNQEVEFNNEKRRYPDRQREMPRRAAPRIPERDLEQKIESIRIELKALSASLKTLNTEVEKAVSEVPVQPGIYHLNFLERLKGMLQVLRQQVDDSRSWLALWAGRKEKRAYWRMYKKHGTTFGLSYERTMATQAG